MIEKNFIEIVKTVTQKELAEFDTAAKSGGKPIVCPDQFAAIIEITQSKVGYLKNDFINLNRKDEQEGYQQNNIPIIALILESPHKTEFNIKSCTCYGPAMGKTSESIGKFLLGNIVKYVCIKDLKDSGAYFLKKTKIEPGRYRVFFVNTIQYNTSVA